MSPFITSRGPSCVDDIGTNVKIPPHNTCFGKVCIEYDFGRAIWIHFEWSIKWQFLRMLSKGMNI